MKQLRFPKFTSFDELFSEYRTGYEVGKQHWPVIELRPGWRPERKLEAGELYWPEATIGEYCRVLDGHSLHVRPTPEVIRSIREDCVVPDAGPLCFQIVGRGKTALVLWHYNSILGSRWLANIDTKTIPKGALT